MRFMTICWIYKVVGRIVVSAAACYKTKRSALLVWWKSKLMADCQLNCGQLPGYNGSTFLSKILKKVNGYDPFQSLFFWRYLIEGQKDLYARCQCFAGILPEWGVHVANLLLFSTRNWVGGVMSTSDRQLLRVKMQMVFGLISFCL